MLRIGDFAKLAQVTVKTLHHYDELGLIKPVQVDDMTGYRYYSATQLPKMNQILALKGLGLSLEHISSILQGDLSPDEMRGILKLRRSELETQLRATELQLSQVIEKLETLDTNTSYDVLLKAVPAQRIISARQEVSDFDDVRPVLNALFAELFAYLKPHGHSTEQPLVLYHNSESGPPAIEAGLRLEKHIPASDHIQVYELAAFDKVISVIHQGSYRHLPQAYHHVARWLETHHHTLISPARELYLHYEAGDSSKHVTEIQIPIV